MDDDSAIARVQPLLLKLEEAVVAEAEALAMRFEFDLSPPRTKVASAEGYYNRLESLLTQGCESAVVTRMATGLDSAKWGLFYKKVLPGSEPTICRFRNAPVPVRLRLMDQITLEDFAVRFAEAKHWALRMFAMSGREEEHESVEFAAAGALDIITRTYEIKHLGVVRVGEVGINGVRPIMDFALESIVREMIEAGYACPDSEKWCPSTGATVGPRGDGDGLWEGWSLYGNDSIFCALAAPDCPEGAKVFLRRIVKAPADPGEPYWKNKTLAEYLKHYHTHPEYEAPHWATAMGTEGAD